MKKVLLIATVQSHICQFHRPLVAMLHEHDCEVHVAARNNLAEKNGLKLEVNDVDAGLPSHFMYAEVEYPDEPTARAWTPADDALTHYLSNECTGQPGASMGEYWTETRK